MGEKVGVSSLKSSCGVGEGVKPFTERKELLAGVNCVMVGVVGVLKDDLSIGLGVPGCDGGLPDGSLLSSREDFGIGSILLSLRSGVVR